MRHKDRAVYYLIIWALAWNIKQISSILSGFILTVIWKCFLNNDSSHSRSMPSISCSDSVYGQKRCPGLRVMATGKVNGRPVIRLYIIVDATTWVLSVMIYEHGTSQNKYRIVVCLMDVLLDMEYEICIRLWTKKAKLTCFTSQYSPINNIFFFMKWAHIYLPTYNHI